jgi:TM2 domain-containing membrane protein YozV
MSIIFVNGRRIRANRGGQEQPRNKTIAAVFAFAGGIIGAHKLYLRDTGGFIFFLILFIMSINILGLPLTALLGVFQGMGLLNMSQQEFDSKYNGGYVQRGDTRIEKRRAEQMQRYESEDVQKGYRQAPEPIKQRSNPFKSSGVAKYKEFDLDGAIEDFNKGLEIDPNDVALNFNIACAFSLTEQKDLAFKHLAKAVSLGFSDFERILTHDDLAFLRIQPEFDTFKQSGFRVYTGGRTAPTMKATNQDASATSTVQSTSNPSDASSNNDNLLAQLGRLAELRDKGILSEAEFALEKRKLERQ